MSKRRNTGPSEKELAEAADKRKSLEKAGARTQRTHCEISPTTT